MDKYIIDTNILIAAYRRSYPLDIIPSFWDSLLVKAKEKRFYVIDEVQKEILVGEDKLSEWLKDNEVNITFLRSDDEKVIESYSEIIESIVMNPRYTLKAKREYASIADSWLIAHAKAYGYTIVTEEGFDAHSKRRIMIPNVCHDFDIKYINTVSFLRALEIRI